MKYITLAASSVLMTAQSALAGPDPNSVCASSSPFATQVACSTAVPEISALEGTAALAFLAAVVLIIWERHRKSTTA